MKKIWAILLMSTAAPAVAASVYECSGKNGQTTYTQNPSGSHCRPANLGAPSIYSAAPVPAIRNTEAPAAAPAASSHQSDVRALFCEQVSDSRIRYYRLRVCILFF